MDFPSTDYDRVQGSDFPKLPKQLDEIPSAKEFPLFRHRWNSNEEVAAVLTAFDKHKEWMSLEVKIRPPSGSMILYSRKKVRYKKDGYCWKKRKGGKNIREDHMKLKVQGLECIYGSYVHSDVLPTFHRRCYWLLQNPDIVLIHYLNVPYPDDGKVKIPMMPCSAEKKEWTKEELVEQLRPMFSAGSSDQMLEETVETLVKHLIQYHESQDKVKVQNVGYKKISCHSNGNGATTSGDNSMAGSEDSQCKDLLMNTVCQLNAKTQQSFPSSGQSRHPGVVHIQTKTNEVVPCSENLTQTPFLLSVSQLHTSQYLLLSDGGQNSTVTTSGCQLHPIPHVLDQPIHHLSHPLQPGEVTLGFRGDNSLPKSHHVPQNVPGQLNVFAHPNSTDTLPKSHVMYSDTGSCQPVGGDAGHMPPLENVSANDIHSIINGPYSVNTAGSYGILPQTVTCAGNNNIPVDSFCSGQHVMSSDIKSSETYNNYQQNSVFSSSTQSNGNSFQQAVPFSISTSENSSNSFPTGMTTNASTPGNFNDFSEEMAGNSCTLETSSYNILDNLDFEISDIEKLCDDLTGTSDSTKDHDMNKHRPCDAELANEIDLFNCDLVQSCQGQADQGFSNISSVCDSKGNENKSCEVSKEQNIVDYSPEWATTQGGEKVLVVGPWCTLSAQYECVFDKEPVPTTLVQPGVLKCYSPAHSEGTSTLQVRCDGHVISNSVPFKFVDYKQDDWFSISDDELRLLLLDRLYIIQEKMKKSTSRLSLQKLREERQSDQFEKKIVLFVKSLVSRPWGNTSDFPKAGKYRMTLLHLAAALGWEALVHSLIVWRTENPSWVLDCEVDSQAVDDKSCTPMVWACAKGHRSIVQFLFHWNPDSVDILTRDGLSPSKIAQKFGHMSVVSELSSLSKEGRKDLFSLSREMDSSGKHASPNCKMDKAGVFKTPDSVLGSLHIDIPGQFDQSARSSVLSKSQAKHSLHQSGTSRRKLAKHFSIDCTPEDFSYIPPPQYDRPVRETNSEPRLCSVSDALTSAKNPMLCNSGRDLTSPDILINAEGVRMKAAMMDHFQTPSVHVIGTNCVEMDTDADDNMSDDFSSSAGSPYIDVERVSSDEEDHVTRIRTDRLSISGDNSEDAKRQMVNLAQQIIAAMPMRIKLSPSRVDDPAEFAARERSSSYSSIPSQPSPHASSFEEDSGISTPMGDGFAFDEYRYSDLGTPASSLNSPESSPYSPYDFKLDSPPPTTEEFTEYFNAPATFMEKDFSLLTLSDQEQRKLYEAAKIIQKTYRKFRNKQQMTQQQKEMEAAVLIQKYYRRYKQYAYYKKMTQAAVLIQSQFRSYYAQKRFKKSRDAAVVIQNQYRTYKEHERLKKGGNKSVIIQQRYRSHYQRIPKHVVPNSDGQIVQIVPDGADSTQADPSSTPDSTPPPADDSDALPSCGDEN